LKQNVSGWATVTPFAALEQDYFDNPANILLTVWRKKWKSRLQRLSRIGSKPSDACPPGTAAVRRVATWEESS